MRRAVSVEKVVVELSQQDIEAQQKELAAKMAANQA